MELTDQTALAYTNMYFKSTERSGNKGDNIFKYFDEMSSAPELGDVFRSIYGFSFILRSLHRDTKQEQLSKILKVLCPVFPDCLVAF